MLCTSPTRIQKRLQAAFDHTRFCMPPVYVDVRAGMREISMEEWQATPVDYLRHPDLNPRLWSRAPGDKAIENEREKLFSKYGRQDPDPSTPAGDHGHH
jgi:hypothetical protein